MSKRRKPGDIVYLRKNTGFVGESDKYPAEIMPEDNPWSCTLDCGDPDCREWATLLTIADENGKRYPIYHVNECEMFDSYEDAKSANIGPKFYL